MKGETQTRKNLSSGAKLLYVMVVVFIVCGGNGIGLLTAAVIWRKTRNLALAISMMLAITLLAFGFAVLVIVMCHRVAAQNPPGEMASGAEPDPQVISEE